MTGSVIPRPALLASLPLISILALVWLAIRQPGAWGRPTILGFACLYAVAIWAKTTTPLILGVALMFTRLFQPVGWRGALQATAAIVLGWALFAVSWVGIMTAAGMPIDEIDELGRKLRDRLSPARELRGGLGAERSKLDQIERGFEKVGLPLTVFPKENRRTRPRVEGNRAQIAPASGAQLFDAHGGSPGLRRSGRRP